MGAIFGTPGASAVELGVVRHSKMSAVLTHVPSSSTIARFHSLEFTIFDAIRTTNESWIVSSILLLHLSELTRGRCFQIHTQDTNLSGTLTDFNRAASGWVRRQAWRTGRQAHGGGRHRCLHRTRGLFRCRSFDVRSAGTRPPAGCWKPCGASP